MEIGECISLKTHFKVIKITKQLCDEVQEAFEIARKQDKISKEFIYGDSNPWNTWKMIYKFHGIVWDENVGFYFLANYGTENQRAEQSIMSNDRIIESSLFDEQFLLSEKEYQRYFATVI